MDYNLLLDYTVELGYQLAMNGAETYRIEESVTRALDAYGINAEVFAIPNCLHVSIKTPDGTPLTKMRRIGHHGNNLDAMEVYSNLCRRICGEKPDLQIFESWLNEAKHKPRSYNLLAQLIGGFLAGCGYCIVFGGGFIDCIWAGICGVAVCLVNSFLSRLKVNSFFATISAAFVMSLIAYSANAMALTPNADAAIIGTLMILVPGLLFTNALRDIIFGDTNSGINRIVQVFLVAAAIALGTGAAWKLSSYFLGNHLSVPAVSHNLLIHAIACFIGCYGFVVLFNIHGRGSILCALGGMLTWITYRLTVEYSGNTYLANFFAILIAALYSEIMARVRKYPATAYLVISAFPLLPGAGIYYTMYHAVRGDMSGVINQGTNTIAIAGILAVGILLVSTVFRFISLHKKTTK